MKTALAAKRKSVQSQISDLKRKRRELAKSELPIKAARLKRFDDQINGLSALLNLYKASVVPVQFENGFVINGTILKSFTKKLPKGCKVDALFYKGALLINYKTGLVEGEFSLNNLAEYYEGINMQKGEELLAELGININQTCEEVHLS